MQRCYGGTMEGWTIYYDPLDYPGRYVVRRWVVDNSRFGPEPKNDPKPCWVGETLEGARASLPPGLYLIPRFDTDAPPVVECWI